MLNSEKTAQSTDPRIIPELRRQIEWILYAKDVE
jgi:hypothetical protein